MYGVYLVVVLVLTGGAVAFIGDRLGTRIGKKRLSILGLRPRHTSIIITIATGICITLLTFGMMAVVSEDVRTALFGMEQLNAKMERTGRDLSSAVEELAGTKEALSLAQQEQTSAQEALKRSRNEMEELRQEQEELRLESEHLKAGNRELSEQNEGLSAMNEELLGNNEELSAANVRLEDTNKDLEERTKALRDGLLIMREGDIIFRAGEIIGSGVVIANRPREEIEADLEQIANLALRNASTRLGAALSVGDLLFYQPEYDAAVATIEESSQDMVVRFVAAGNLIKGEPVRAGIQLYPNSIIYQKEEFIIGRAYNVRSDSDAEEIVMSFLQDVNAAATAKGILQDPISGAVGVIEGEQFYSVVQAIMPLRGTIALSAYARSATDAMGPLRLNLKLEQIGDTHE